MKNCETQLGFFVLTPCNNETDLLCINCGRAVCEQHSEPHADGVRCLECSAKSSYSLRNAQRYRSDYDGFEKEVWTYHNRREAMEVSLHEPFIIADYEAFAKEAELDLDGDFAGGAFFDS